MEENRFYLKKLLLAAELTPGMLAKEVGKIDPEIRQCQVSLIINYKRGTEHIRRKVYAVLRSRLGAACPSYKRLFPE